MDEIPDARDIDRPTAEEMVELVDPTFEFEHVEPAERGFCSVYRVEGGDPPQEYYLKISPDGQPWGIPVEARVQAVLAAETSLPVPEVVGVVDGHDRLPTPYYLMEARPGEELPYEHVARCEDGFLRRLARETGAYLAELHGVPAVEQFGHVRHDGPDLSGAPPAGDPSVLSVGDPHDSWPAYLRERVDQELQRHADSRFDGLTADLEAFFEEAIGELSGPFDPVLGRNDHGLHNLLVKPATGAITGMLDWGYTLAVPAAFDVAFAAYLYSGAFMAGLPEVRDRRPLVREAMLEGYRSVAPERAAALELDPAYEVLAMIRIMNDFGHLDLPEGTETAVADRVREDGRDLLSGTR